MAKIDDAIAKLQRQRQQVLADSQPVRNDHSPEPQEAPAQQVERRCCLCPRAVQQLLESRMLQFRPTCVCESPEFAEWLDFSEAQLKEKRFLLFKTLSPQEAPNTKSQLSDKQSRLIAYSIIFDCIYGKYAGKRRARRKLPVCVVIAIRDKWPEDVDPNDLIAAGHNPVQSRQANRDSDDSDSLSDDSESDED